MEITDILNYLLKKISVKFIIYKRGIKWLDMGYNVEIFFGAVELIKM